MKSPCCIRKSDLEAALAALGRKRAVFAPVEGEDGLRLKELPAEGRVSLEMRTPFLPLKTLFLPAVENMLAYRKNPAGTTVTPAPPPTRDRVVFGALGCDIAALATLDRVFSEDPPDEAYRERRDRTILVAQACTREAPECFCASFAIDPLRPSGADALLTDVGGAYLLESLTPKGDELWAMIGRLRRKPSAEERRVAAGLTAHSRSDLPVERIPSELDELWEHDVWADLAACCIGCGTCTVLCPTCHCFDVQDERKGSAGRRFRTWDSCMFGCFTRMAGGDNPRSDSRARVRQRFLHKLLYFRTNHDLFSCVGCGRCSVSCPSGIGIDEVIARLSRKEVSDE